MHTAKRHGFLNLLTRAITVEQGGRGCPQILGTHVVLLWNRRFPGAGSEPFGPSPHYSMAGYLLATLRPDPGAQHDTLTGSLGHPRHLSRGECQVS